MCAAAADHIEAVHTPIAGTAASNPRPMRTAPPARPPKPPTRALMPPFAIFIIGPPGSNRVNVDSSPVDSSNPPAATPASDAPHCRAAPAAWVRPSPMTGSSVAQASIWTPVAARSTPSWRTPRVPSPSSPCITPQAAVSRSTLAS